MVLRFLEVPEHLASELTRSVDRTRSRPLAEQLADVVIQVLAPLVLPVSVDTHESREEVNRASLVACPVVLRPAQDGALALVDCRRPRGSRR